MAENVVKNKIVIEGEAKYKQTLREISQQLREAKSEVKAASAEMKAQGQTTESVRGKLDALSNVYKAQTEQLKTMQEHLEKVEAAYGENSREASELRTRINNLRAETAGTSGEMKNLEQQLDNMGDAAQGAKDDLSGLDGDLRGVGDAAGDAAGELEGLPGILGQLGQGIDIGVGLQLGENMFNAIKEAIKTAALTGFNEAVQDRKGANLVGIQTGTLGTQYNDMMYDAMEKLMLRQPAISTEQASGYAASIWTRAAGTDYVRDAESMLDIMQATYAAEQQTGIGFDQIAEGAKNMSAAFGSDFKDNVQLIASIGQSNAGAKGVDVIEKYGQAFVSLGMGVEEAAGAVVHASDAGIDDVGKYGKAVEALATWMKDLTSETEGVEELGLLGDDLGKKFDAGGETAANAVDLVINKLKGIQDTDLQNELGEKIFGSQAWDRYGMNVADAILAGYGEEFLSQARTQNERAVEALTDDLESQTQIIGNVLTESMGDTMAPLADAATEVAKAASSAMIEAYEGGAKGLAGVVLPGFEAGMAEAGGQWKKIWDEAAEESKGTMEAAFGENWADATNPIELLQMSTDEHVRNYAETWLRGFENIKGWIGDGLSTVFSSAGAEGYDSAEQAASETMSGYDQGIQQSIDETVEKIRTLNEIIGNAYDMGDPALAEAVKAERDAAIKELNDLQAKMAEEGKDAGGELDEGFQTGAENIQVTVEDTATGMVTALEPFKPQILSQGEELGVQLDEGWLKGAEPVPGDAEDTVDSVIGELSGGIDRAYSAGYKTGAAYERGYKAALGQHSPSRVMLEAAEDTISPLFSVMEDGESEVYSRAEALGDAVSGGYSDAAGSGPVLASGGFAGAGLAVDPAGIAEAVRAALTGMGVFMDGRPVGELAEPYVSEATSRRAAGTVRGVSAGARGW